MASAPPFACSAGSSSLKAKTSNASHVTSVLLIQKGPTLISRTAPSLVGSATFTVPAGIGTISKETVEPGIFSV